MGEVVEICQQRFFTREEARALLPTIQKILEKHERVITKLLSDQRYFISTHAPQERITECDDKISEQMARCGAKIHKLGVKVFGDGWFGFCTGGMYWSYHWPEDKDINYYHGLLEDPRRTRYLYHIVKATP